MSKQYDFYLTNLEQLAKKVGNDPMSIESQRGARHLVDSLAIALEAHCLLSHGGISCIDFIQMICSVFIQVYDYLTTLLFI